jgi:hypothetical protein
VKKMTMGGSITAMTVPVPTIRPSTREPTTHQGAVDAQEKVLAATSTSQPRRLLPTRKRRDIGPLDGDPQHTHEHRQQDRPGPEPVSDHAVDALCQIRFRPWQEVSHPMGQVVGEFETTPDDLHSGVRLRRFSQVGLPFAARHGAPWLKPVACILSQAATRQVPFFECPDDLWVILQEPEG